MAGLGVAECQPRRGALQWLHAGAAPRTVSFRAGVALSRVGLCIPSCLLQFFCRNHPERSLACIFPEVCCVSREKGLNGGGWRGWGVVGRVSGVGLNWDAAEEVE